MRSWDGHMLRQRPVALSGHAGRVGSVGVKEAMASDCILAQSCRLRQEVSMGQCGVLGAPPGPMLGGRGD